MLQENFCLILKQGKLKFWKKHACQNMVAMEISSHVDSDVSYQIVAS